jgi:hypothetical protein
MLSRLQLIQRTNSEIRCLCRSVPIHWRSIGICLSHGVQFVLQKNVGGAGAAARAVGCTHSGESIGTGKGKKEREIKRKKRMFFFFFQKRVGTLKQTP